MQDVVNLESELMKNMVSGIASKLLKSILDAGIDFQIEKFRFHAENKGGEIESLIDIKAEMRDKDAKKICKKLNLPEITPEILKVLPDKCLLKYPVHGLEEQGLKMAVKKKTGIKNIKIQHLKCKSKESRYHIHLKAAAKMKEEKLHSMLENFQLL